jgi:hypothetical protein
MRDDTKFPVFVVNILSLLDNTVALSVVKNKSFAFDVPNNNDGSDVRLIPLLIWIFFNNTQPLNAFILMSFTIGIYTDDNLEHGENANSPIDVVFDRFIVVIALQELNELLPILVIRDVSGKFASLMQLLNALSPIRPVKFGIDIVVSPLW